MNESVRNSYLLNYEQSSSSQPFRRKRTSSARAGYINIYQNQQYASHLHHGYSSTDQIGSEAVLAAMRGDTQQQRAVSAMNQQRQRHRVGPNMVIHQQMAVDGGGDSIFDNSIAQQTASSNLSGNYPKDQADPRLLRLQPIQNQGVVTNYQQRLFYDSADRLPATSVKKISSMSTYDYSHQKEQQQQLPYKANLLWLKKKSPKGHKKKVRN